MASNNSSFFLILLFIQILYTGDFSRQEDRHLMAAEIPSISPDVLIIVSFFPFCCYYILLIIIIVIIIIIIIIINNREETQVRHSSFRD